ncbi:helix-turn-helix domain-containing protein [Aquimarina sp. 2-A2]|uniref:helix-turn-helix domain-containing protein n=1 Tax=Aquimarina sp. 2-A2 TaxID=3382644 RepID=UPI00387F0BF9
MDLEQQALFIFSALGAINGFLLSIYFAFLSKDKQRANYFLSALLFVLSVRIIKSVFFYFNPGLAELFIQIGLSACVLIGPFLYLYCTTVLENKKGTQWIIHTVPAILIISILGMLYPYWDHKAMWSKGIVKLIYIQWFIYIILTTYKVKTLLKNLFLSRSSLRDIEIWVLSIYLGTTLIWLGYTVGSYTSYIVGAISFSVVFYLGILFWILKRPKKKMFYQDSIKYENKKINPAEAANFQAKLDQIVQDAELYKNPNLKLKDVATLLQVLPHYLSQFLNDNLNKSFSLFINEYRIKEAKTCLRTKSNLTIEAIAYECGFNSKSTFFTAFKKITGSTPSTYRSVNT